MFSYITLKNTWAKNAPTLAFQAIPLKFPNKITWTWAMLNKRNKNGPKIIDLLLFWAFRKKRKRKKEALTQS